MKATVLIYEIKLEFPGSVAMRFFHYYAKDLTARYNLI